MISLMGKTYPTNVSEILDRLEEQTGKIRRRKKSADDTMLACPFHKDGQEQKPSFGINNSTGVCHCFACGYSAPLARMIGNLFGEDDRTALQFGIDWLDNEFFFVESEERPDIELSFSRFEQPKVTTFVPETVLKTYRYYHPYMFKRKLSKQVINMFDVGYDRQTNCLTFPVRSVYGSCLFVARRSVANKWFNYPSGAEKPLYGVFELNKYEPNSKFVIVCESMINALTCWNYCYPAIALCGTGSSEQYKLLSSLPQRELIIALDPDKAGEAGKEKIKKYVRGKILYTVDYKDSRDINDLDDNEFNELISTKHLL